MAADDFTWHPTWVRVEKREYHNVRTPSESGKIVRQNISSLPTKMFKLEFSGLDDADFELVKAHYDGRLGGFDTFDWTTVPSYIDGGTDKTVAYVDGSFKPKPQARSWDLTIKFEEVV